MNTIDNFSDIQEKRLKIIFSILILVYVFGLTSKLFSYELKHGIYYDQVIQNRESIIYYNYEYKNTVYTKYVVTKDNVDEVNIKKRPGFKSDKRIPKKYKSYTSDYTRSGYDRGHLAPDASFDYNRTVLNEFYLMSNITPQLPRLNRKAWKNLEEDVRNKARTYGNVQVQIIIEYYNDKEKNKIGKHKIRIPKIFFKYIKYPKYFIKNRITQKAPVYKKECYAFYNKLEKLESLDIIDYKIKNTICESKIKQLTLRKDYGTAN